MNLQNKYFTKTDSYLVFDLDNRIRQRLGIAAMETEIVSPFV